MADIFPKAVRSRIMASIKQKNTKIEKAVFKKLNQKKIYFQKHLSNILGTPDISSPSKKKVIFLDGDFWHGYQFTKLEGRLPKKFWIPKIERNIKRDKKYRQKLRKEGWKILRVWEHEIEKDLDKAVEKIIKFLS
ncbi:MAG: very short patch repair endonuclease [bacterium]|nr:very short patch repair endonuclease [bacterium]